MDQRLTVGPADSDLVLGPLPAEVQNYTSYGAALLTNAGSLDAAKAFLAYLATPEAKQTFVAAGIE